jgi:hypothetical protein
MARPLPGLDVPVLATNPQTGQLTGFMTQAWYEYFSQHQKLVQLPDVSTTAPTNGQVLTYDSTLQKWKPV